MLLIRFVRCRLPLLEGRLELSESGRIFLPGIAHHFGEIILATVCWRRVSVTLEKSHIVMPPVPERRRDAAWWWR